MALEREQGPARVQSGFCPWGGPTVSTSSVLFVSLSSRPSGFPGDTEAREVSHLPRVTCPLEEARALWPSGGQRDGVRRAAG